MTTTTSLICLALVAAAGPATADTYSGVLRTDIGDPTLESLVPKAARVKVREGATTLDITNAADIAAIEKALNADQPVLATTPRCLTAQTLELDDAKGNVLGTVGFCDGPNGWGGYEQPPVFLDAKHVATHGLANADAPALEKVLLKYRKAP